MTRASSPGGTGRRRSRVSSVSFAASASAVENGIPCGQNCSVKGRRLRLQAAVRRHDDLVDSRLGLAQLRLAVALQLRAPLVGLNRLVQLAGTTLETAHDLLELGKRFLEAHLDDVGRQFRLGQDPSQICAPLYGRE